MILRPLLAQRVFDTPLLMHRGKAVAGLAGIGGRIVEGGVHFDGEIAIDHIAGDRLRPSAGRIGDRLGAAYDRDARDPFPVIDGVAVVGVEGTLVHKGGYVGMSSGDTSYEGLQTQIVRAGRNPAVQGVVFEFDSFGGEVAGAFETASMLRRLSVAKPTLAILTDYALSAAYLLASQCRAIVMPETGWAGSIGVITLHADLSGALEKEGVKVTVLTAGAHKADGNPYQALPEDVATRIRAQLEAGRQLFANAVAEGRGTRLTAEAALATEADYFTGPDAVRLGLADAFGEGNAAFEMFVAAVTRGAVPAA